MYIALVNVMMRFLAVVVFNFIIAYLVLMDNVKERNLILGSINIAEQVKTLY